jgi:hypothetical protein
MTARWLLVIFGASLAACTDFDSVPREVCGNGVLEPGEDCDSAEARCVRCAVTCAEAADCPSADHACGLDGLCHAPGGELARATAPVTFQADDLRVTDIDHDGRGDVVGVSQTSIVVRYGDAAGALTASASLVTPAQAGPASFGDLDGDGSLDVTLATVDGLVTYSSAFGALSPVDVETPILDGATGMPFDLVKTFAIGPVAFGGFAIDSGIVVMLVYDFADVDAAAFGAPCAARLGAIPRADFDLAKVDVYRASPAGAPTRQFVVSFVTGSGAACVMSVHGSTAAGYTLADITPAGIAPLARTPILADLDTDLDPCPGLVRSDDGAAGRRARRCPRSTVRRRPRSRSAGSHSTRRSRSSPPTRSC